MKTAKHGLWALVALITLTTGVAAQDMTMNDKMPIRDPGNGSISGRVMLPSGVNTSHLKIILNNSQAPLTTIYSNDQGEFSFDNLRAGIYYVQIYPDEKLYKQLTQEVHVKPGSPVYLSLYLIEKVGLTGTDAGTRKNVVSAADSAQGIPASARKAFDEARKLTDKGDFDSAIVKLNKAIAIYPDYVTARNSLGVQYLKQKHLPEAAEQFRIILKKDPKYFDAHLNLGIVLVEQRQFDQATDELGQAVSLDSTNPAAHLFWGIAALNQNDLPVAEREVVKALLFGGERYSNAHYYFGHIYLKTGRREEAAHEFAIFLKNAPSGDMATQARAMLQQLNAKQ
jgi:tetratricopeptide (TPR) repeat protein